MNNDIRQAGEQVTGKTRAQWRLSEDGSTYVLLGLPHGVFAEVSGYGNKFQAVIDTPKRKYTHKRQTTLATAKRNAANMVKFLVGMGVIKLAVQS